MIFPAKQKSADFDACHPEWQLGDRSKALEYDILFILARRRYSAYRSIIAPIVFDRVKPGLAQRVPTSKTLNKQHNM